MVVMYTMGGGLINIFIALSLVNWAGTARIVRSQTLSLKEKEYVEAARSIGVKKWVIMFRHILPNCIPSLIVLFTLNIPSAILSEASLSFLLGPDGCSRQKISVLGAVAFHRAECGHHDRGHGIQLPGGWPPGCAGPIFKRTVKERRDEPE